MLGAIVTYERRLATQMGIDPASVQKVSSDPRSGYSIAMSKESMRDAQEKYQFQFRTSDMEAISKAAMISNAILNTNYPEDGYIISYEAIELSEMEAKAQRENIIALLDKNLIGPVDAMMKLYPDITTEEQAVEKLRTIRQQKIEFA
jgi:NACalpha-BTF3-like transcription factor